MNAMTQTPAVQTPEVKWGKALKAAGLADKANYRLGEVCAVTGFTREAVLKMKSAGTLTPWRPEGYNWDCYPRQQVMNLINHG